ncbi:MAG: DNA polymerase III subunit epsilon [Alphaproteobacteria bacterium]|nr:DNA polymerase III subunit epsilon [Alphaproteobacteria bacterium]
MREIVFDTETTGIDPADGHRVIEIGCIELMNHLPTGRNLHLYVNPERDVPQEVVAVHGITGEFLADKPVFAAVYSEFLDFIEGATLVAHNAAFDIKFLNHELKLVGHKGLGAFRVVDTLMIARKKFPGSPANLDALCRRFNIDNSARTLHGALLDSEILADVYLELLGGRQHGLGLAVESGAAAAVSDRAPVERPYRAPRPFPVSEEEKRLHAEMVGQLKDPLWAK